MSTATTLHRVRQATAATATARARLEGVETRRVAAMAAAMAAGATLREIADAAGMVTTSAAYNKVARAGMLPDERRTQRGPIPASERGNR